MSQNIQDAEIKKIAESLSEKEIVVLKKIKELGKVDSTTLQELTGLSQVEVIRALQWLSNKGLVRIKREEKKIVDLGLLGREYIKKGLPERRLLKHLVKLKAIRFEDAEKRIGLSKEELQAALGALKRRLLVAIEHGKIILKVKAEEANKKSLEERFLEELPLEIDSLTPENRYAFQQLKKRKEIVDIKKTSYFITEITEKGKVLSKISRHKKMIEALTPELIKSGEWKESRFKRYDISVRVPTIFGGRRQAYYAFLEEVKEELIRLGFEEMMGPTIESEFWNFDALFQPQFHVARDWSSTYYVRNVKVELPDEKIVEAVKREHEKGWQYSWSLDKAKKAILRPQGTCISARMLANNPKIPGKYFAIARCYRPDVIDAQHLAEFNQVEGIILDKEITFRHLLGQLKQFAEVFAKAKQIKFIPDYYPFTEPSVQLNIKHEKLGWIEIGGAGIFREELCKALNINVPVIAWGLGIDRLAMFKLNVKDIRMLFSQDLEWLRNVKMFER